MGNRFDELLSGGQRQKDCRRFRLVDTNKETRPRAIRPRGSEAVW